jgi:flavin-dependent dehydrogenase
VGDAAGLASPLHGGGIDIACISGILAARAIGAASSEQYMQSVQKILGSRQNLEQKIFEYLEKTEITSINEFMKIGFGQPDKISTLKKIKQAITQEATLLQYVMQGHVQADWTNGLILDDLPLTAKPLIRKIMSGQITH